MRAPDSRLACHRKTESYAMPFKRIAIFVHRWLGVALCLFFLLWFPSGIGMMYWDFPSVTAADRLDREPEYLVHLGGGGTRIAALDGHVRAEFDRQRIAAIVREAAAPIGLAAIRALDQYDVYYLDRHRQRPLPVIAVTLNDPERNRFYIDPKTARVVGTYSSRNWITRWLYHGLHSLDVPWLYNHRPAWHIVVVTFMLGGTALAVTSLVLAWRVLGRTLTRSSAAGAASADD